MRKNRDAVLLDDTGSSERRFFRTALLLVAVSMLLAAALHFVVVVPRIRNVVIERWQRELSLNADLRQSAVERWIRDRTTDANVIARFPSTLALMEERTKDGGREHLTQILTDVSKEHGFTSVVAASTDGTIVAASSATERALLDCASAFVREPGGTRSGISLCDPDGESMVLIASPIETRDEPPRTIGSVVVMVEAKTWLAPFFGVRPTSISSGEALLVAADGDSLRYLTPLPGTRNANSVRVPRETPRLAGAAALAGHERFGRFVDYRAVPVWAVTRVIPGTTWGLVVKVDERDVVAEADHDARPIGVGIVFGGALLGIAGAVVLRWQGRNERRAGRASRSLVQAIIDSAPASVHAIDREARVTLWNPESEKIFGWRADEVLGEPLPIVDSVHREEFRERVGLTLAGRPPAVGTVRRVRKDGSSVDLLMSVAPLHGEDGDVSGALAVAIDVTGTIETEVRARALFESGIIGCLFGDIHGHISEANDTFLSIIDYTRDELDAGSIRWDTITPSEWSAADERGIAEARRLGRCAPYEKEYVRRDGTRVPVVVGFQLLDPERVKSIAFILDISALKREQHARRRAESAFGALFETPGVPIAMLERRGDALTLVECNAAYAETLGRPAPALNGKRLDELGVDEKILESIRSGASGLDVSGGTAVFETAANEGDEQRRYVVSLTLMPAPPAGDCRLLVVLTDVTSLRQVEGELRRLNEELEGRVAERTEELRAANSELESFSYTVSHDLRAPLRAISGFSRLVEEEYGSRLDDEGRRLVEVIRSSTRSMGQLIDDLLSFSRAGRQPVNRADVSMTDLAHAVWAELPEARRARASFVVGELPDAQGDAALVRQVWSNLLDNALKYSSRNESPRIEAGYTDANSRPAWYVRDNGVGFDAKYASRMFGVFQRLHSSREFEGTGVGLAIVQRIVQRHGGHVWAEGEEGKGATFFFTLGE